MTDPFADRAAILAEMRLDERGWSKLEEHWRHEIARRAAAGDRSLREAFATAFAAERGRLAQARERRAQVASATASQGEGAAGNSGVDTTATAIDIVAKPALPFAGKRHPPPATASHTLTSDGAGGTVKFETLDEKQLDDTLPFDKE